MRPFLVLGEVNIDGKTIRLFWRELPILRVRRIFFSPAAIGKVCFQATRSSPHCSRAVASGMNSTPDPADTIGTSGIAACPNCLRGCGVFWDAISMFLLREADCVKTLDNHPHSG